MLPVRPVLPVQHVSSPNPSDCWETWRAGVPPAGPGGRMRCRWSGPERYRVSPLARAHAGAEHWIPIITWRYGETQTRYATRAGDTQSDTD